MTDNAGSAGIGHSQFPAHDGPRVWLLSSGDCPIGISLTRQLLAHGDYVVVGIPPDNEREDSRTVDFERFVEEISENSENGWKERFEAVALDIRNYTDGKSAVIGSVEELAASERTRMLVKSQFETNYFGPVNLIRAALPHMRIRKAGHIMISGGITGHIGTPGLGVYCAAGWALEGFCDSLAYEVAPFNIRVTILQSNMEIGILANLVTSVPPLFPAYSPTENHAPLFRGIMNSILLQLPGANGYSRSDRASPASQASISSAESGKLDSNLGDEQNLPLSSTGVVSLYPPLSPEHLDILLAETIHVITAIGGHENPPARHIVGTESVSSVKEKLKTVSEELEDFIECSCAVDINNSESAMRAANDGTVAQVDFSI
ncbi:hypothetical protein FQN57_002350 [Myotisia sp. PD_48]|nr:hypothetical protein FQN57_002350 [Myotisia sp. PD_48]